MHGEVQAFFKEMRTEERGALFTNAAGTLIIMANMEEAAKCGSAGHGARDPFA